GGSATAVGMRRAATGPTAPAPPTIPTTGTRSCDDTTRRPRPGPQRSRGVSGPPDIPDGDGQSALPATPTADHRDLGLAAACRVSRTRRRGVRSARPRARAGAGRPGEQGQTDLPNLPGPAAVPRPRTGRARALRGMGWAVETRTRRPARPRPPPAAACGVAGIHSAVRRAPTDAGAGADQPRRLRDHPARPR